jgi:hypothetical protein
LIHKLRCHLLHSREHLHVVWHHGVLVSLSGAVCTLVSRLVLELLSKHLLVHGELLLLHHHSVLHHLHILLRGLLWWVWTWGRHLHHRHLHLTTHTGHHSHVHLTHHLGLRLITLRSFGGLAFSFILFVFRCSLLWFLFFNRFFSIFVDDFCDLCRKICF